jgi:hypothetical protein
MSVTTSVPVLPDLQVPLVALVAHTHTSVLNSARTVDSVLLLDIGTHHLGPLVPSPQMALLPKLGAALIKSSSTRPKLLALEIL